MTTNPPNILGITNQVELAKTEEKISKKKAKELFDSKDLDTIEPGTFTGLSFIHARLFDTIYDFAGKIRNVNISKGNFRFAPVLYLQDALKKIDTMPHNTYEQIIQKYIEMNIAHPFREGNGRATRIWLDHLLKHKLKKVIDWNTINKEAYLTAMERSPSQYTEILTLLKTALSDQISNRTLYMQGIDVSYFYENLNHYKTREL